MSVTVGLLTTVSLRRDWLTNGRRDWLTNGRRDWLTNGRRDWPTNGRRDWPTNGRRDWPTNGRRDWLTNGGVVDVVVGGDHAEVQWCHVHLILNADTLFTYIHSTYTHLQQARKHHICETKAEWKW